MKVAGVVRRQADWSFSVLLLLLLVWSCVTLLSGGGLQTRLDARSGIGGERFIADRDRALQGLSMAQINAFEWALRRLDNETLLARYGGSPTVREVIVGEIIRVVDEKNREISELESQLAIVREQVNDSEKQREEVLAALRPFSPTITSISHPDGVGDSQLLVRYRLTIPKNLELKSLPCHLVYRRYVMTRTEAVDFDCLAQPITRNGEYQVRIAAGETVVSFEALYEDAKVVGRSSSEPLMDAVPYSLPALKALRDARRERQLALNRKALM